ncbi:hypothetical protein [Parabacteroides chinchillae]|uniref:Nuclease-related domain-containing protein n=1 Tax=Parabacteroides chinchillae TaxID=871327 RepID=A0A8G2BYA0_9BACT|nr:hypothetical protein [Parabacteroides chinchillae]SEG16325.1 hypothetical protein SAMN05444001_11774 [Parabacteroides chinchillae]
MEKLNLLFDNTLKNIREQKGFNPFSPSFSKENIKKIREDIVFVANSETNMNEEKKSGIIQILHLCDTTFLMSDFSKKGYAHLDSLIAKSNFSQKELLYFSFAALSRDYQLVQKELSDRAKPDKERDKGGKVFSFINEADFKIKSPDQSIGEISASGLVEAGVDSLNTLVKYLLYKDVNDFIVDPIEGNLDSVDTIMDLCQSCNIINMMKYNYENAVWNEGFFVLNEKVLKIDFFSHHELKLKATGLRIMYQRVFSQYSILMSSSFKYPYQAKKRIKNCSVENGYLKYKLSDGQDKEEISHGMNMQASLNAYYEFLKKVPFSAYGNLDIDKVFFMFNLVSYLFTVASKLQIPETAIMEKERFYSYPFRIAKRDLIEYLKIRAGFSSGEIHSFLSLLEYDGTGYLNLWNTPFLCQGADYLFTLLPLTFPMTYNLIDYWLEKGGISLKDRGKHLEQYIIKKLISGRPKQTFPYIVIEQKKFRIDGGKSEEIDLLISMDSTLIVAEVKCIRYPMEVRDYHNALKRLKEGCSQAQRKKEYIKNNHEHFCNLIGDYKDKTILGVVITNYPLFSGFLRLGIPIVDAHSFESYFTGGSILCRSAFQEGDKHVNQVEGAQPLYMTNEEFNKNINHYLMHPPVVEMVMDNTSINMKSP